MNDQVQELLARRPADGMSEVALTAEGTLTIRPPGPINAVTGMPKSELFEIAERDVIVFSERGDTRSEALRFPIAAVEEVDVAFRSEPVELENEPRHVQKHLRQSPAYVRIFYRQQADEEWKAIAIGVGWHATDHGQALANESGMSEGEATYLADLITVVVHERWKTLCPEKIEAVSFSIKDRAESGQLLAERLGRPPGRYLKVKVRADEMLICARHPLSKQGLTIPGFLVGVALIAAACTWTVPFMIPGIVFVALTVPLFLLGVVVRVRLHLRPGSVAYSTNLWPKSWTQTLTADEITAVEVQRHRDVNKQESKLYHLLIKTKGDKNSLTFGLALPKKQLQWAKKAVERALMSRDNRD